MLNNEDAKKLLGLKEEELAELEMSADGYDEGEWPEATVTMLGRPMLYGSRMKSITYRDTEEEIALMDDRAAALEMSRSDYLRFLVRKDLAAARPR